VIGDREFCSVNLTNWLKRMECILLPASQKTHFVELETEIWLHLKELGLSPGVCFFIEGVKVTKLKVFQL